MKIKFKYVQVSMPQITRFISDFNYKPEESSFSHENLQSCKIGLLADVLGNHHQLVQCVHLEPSHKITDHLQMVKV